jgi:anti-sigma regulatory factor (Ser/Thr protein kinase)
MTDRLSLTLDSSLAEVAVLAEALERFGTKHALALETRSTVNVVLEELVTNIIKYGYQGQPGQAIYVEIALRPGVLVLSVEDNAPPFNPLLAPEPDLKVPLHQRKPGGVGLHLVRKLMDHLDYQRTGGKNKLSMIKRL